MRRSCFLVLAGLLAGCGDDASGSSTVTPGPDAGEDVIQPDAGPDAEPEASIEAGPDAAALTTPEGAWYRAAGGQGGAIARAVTTDADGNVYATGTSWGTVDLGGGPKSGDSYDELFIAKYDSSGKHLWSHVVGQYADGTSSAGYQGGGAIAVDASGNVFVGGWCERKLDLGTGVMDCGYYKNLLLAKYSPDGTPLWAKSWGGEGEERVQGLGVDDQGRVHVLGDLNNDIDFGGGPVVSKGYYDAFLATFDTDGKHLASREIGAASLFVSGMAVTASGESVVTGDFSGTMDLGIGALEAQQDSGSNFVVMFDASGTPLWQKAYAPEQTSGSLILRATTAAPAIDSNGHIWLTGSSEGPIAIGNSPKLEKGVFLAGLSSAGNVLHASSQFVATDASGWAIAADATGKVAIVGRYKGKLELAGTSLQSKGEDDAFLATFDVGTGKPIGFASWGGKENDWLYDARYAPSGALVMGGFLTGPVDLGGGLVSKESEGLVFLAQFKP